MKLESKDIGNGTELVATAKDCQDIVVVDADYGKCRSIAIEEGVECLQAPRNPFFMETALIVEYENGKTVEAVTRPIDALTLGQVKAYTEDGRPGFLCNSQVVAAVGLAIASLNPFLKGTIFVPDEGEAASLIKDLDIPSPPLAYNEAMKDRPDIWKIWEKKFKSSGKICLMKNTLYEIESTVSKDRKDEIAKHGESLVLEAIGE